MTANTIRPATVDDRPAIEALLLAASLPIVSVEDHIQHFFVVLDDSQTLVGCAGLEVHSGYGLLRSLAVRPTERGAGIAARLVDQTLQHARDLQLEAVYLLTETAEDYFARRGFTRVVRDHVPAAVKRSRQFVDACPASAVAMEALVLSTKRGHP